MSLNVRPMERMRAGGVELEYEINGSGEPVVFIHGSLGPDGFWPLMKEPALAGLQRIRYRRRGYEGSSGATPGLTIEEQAQDCRNLLRALGVERAHVVGHSYGGLIVLQLAVDAPAVVQSLVLMEPALVAFVPSGQAMMAQLAPLFQLYAQGDKAAAVEAFLQGASGRPNQREITERAVPGSHDQAVRSADTFFEVELPAMADWTFTASDARRLSQPVLFIVGAESPPALREVKDLTLTWLPQTQVHEVPRSGHLLHIENPADVANAIGGFVNAHPMATAAAGDKA